MRVVQQTQTDSIGGSGVICFGSKEILESFYRVEDEGSTRRTFNFTFSRIFSKNRQPRKHCTQFFFTTKVSTLISVKALNPSHRLLNDKISNI